MIGIGFFGLVNMMDNLEKSFTEISKNKSFSYIRA